MKYTILLQGCILALLTLRAVAESDNVDWYRLENELEAWNEPPDPDSEVLEDTRTSIDLEKGPNEYSDDITLQDIQMSEEEDENDYPVDSEPLYDDDDLNKTDSEISEMLRIQQIEENYKASIGIGYNLLRGNPDGDGKKADPGIKKTYRVLEINYEDPKDNPVDLQRSQFCSWSNTEFSSVYVYSGTASYQAALDADIEVEGGPLYDYRYSLSSEFGHVKSSTEAVKQVMLHKEASCDLGTVRYKWDTALNTKHSISEDFYYAMKNLPNSIWSKKNQKKYMDFIEKYGTHFIVEAKMGGKLVQTYSSTYKELYEYASTSISNSISGEGGSASVTVDLKTFNEHVKSSTQFGSVGKGYAVGVELKKTENGQYSPVDPNDIPEPISLRLKPITDALDSRLWVMLPENGKSHRSLKISKKKRLLEWALKKYPSYVKASKGKDKGSAITIPLTELDIWSAGNTRCRLDSPCTYRGYDYRWCYTNDNWEYCCKDKCGYRGKGYTWCSTGKNGNWEYCTAEYPKRRGLKTIEGKKCRKDHPCGKHGHYSKKHWCYTDNKGNWDYCCAPDSKCGKHGYSYNWCYCGDNNSNWDYCKP